MAKFQRNAGRQEEEDEVERAVICPFQRSTIQYNNEALGSYTKNKKGTEHRKDREAEVSV